MICSRRTLQSILETGWPLDQRPGRGRRYQRTNRFQERRFRRNRLCDSFQYRSHGAGEFFETLSYYWGLFGNDKCDNSPVNRPRLITKEWWWRSIAASPAAKVQCSRATSFANLNGATSSTSLRLGTWWDKPSWTRMWNCKFCVMGSRSGHHAYQIIARGLSNFKQVAERSSLAVPKPRDSLPIRTRSRIGRQLTLTS